MRTWKENSLVFFSSTSLPGGEVQTQIDGAQVVSDLKFQFPQVGENPQLVAAVV